MIINTFFRKITFLLIFVFLSARLVLANPPIFRSGVVLQNENEELPGDTSGYTAPCIGDWDGDGDNDLLIGTFQDGPIYFFENVADEGEPVLQLTGALQADGEQINAPYE